MGHAIRFMHYTALRVGDALRVRWRDWKPDGLHVAVSKTKSALLFDRTAGLEALMVDCAGLWLTARADAAEVRPGDTLPVTVTALVRGGATAQLRGATVLAAAAPRRSNAQALDTTTHSAKSVRCHKFAGSASW